MNKEEFFKRKIFDKESVPSLQKTYKSLSKEIQIWYKSSEYKNIQDLKNKLESKLKQFSKNEEIDLVITPEYIFSIYLWYTSSEKKCHYCSLSEVDLDALRVMPDYVNKRFPQRGKVLEIDRKVSTLSYLNIDNLVLSCYWCNNAKTDTFTENEFLAIGKIINKIWSKRLNKIIE